MFCATARNGVAPPTEKQEFPACLPLVLFRGATGDDAMKLAEEKQTEIFLNDAGGITISQADEECPSCGENVPQMVCFGSVGRVRIVAAELLRLAGEMEKAEA